MTKRICLVAFAFLVLIVSFSPPAAAQTTNPCEGISQWWFLLQIPPGWYFYYWDGGDYFYYIAAHKAAPGCSPEPECPCSRASGAPPMPYVQNPTSLTTGDVYIEQTDVSVPGLAGGVNLRRTWNSLWPAKEALYSIGMFGPNWRSTYEERIFVSSDNYLKYSRQDGGFWSFGLSLTGSWVVAAPASESATLVQGTTSWILTFQNGEQRQFSLATGLLTSIIDRNGNTTQLSYDTSNRLVTVTSPASQHLYFNYPNGSSYLVSSVTSDFGLTLSYSYDAQNRLAQVTKPDQTTVSFTYNTQSQVTQVTDSNGKVLEAHTYDSSGRGLTSAQANGVSAVTITYP
ncbi:MAG: DUF6531 domain-containing protein [Anaerolineaceae bacterium]|nr:DUF6531 domain-containing protein [Anaerolineaceae bacterium]